VALVEDLLGYSINMAQIQYEEPRFPMNITFDLDRMFIVRAIEISSLIGFEELSPHDRVVVQRFDGYDAFRGACIFLRVANYEELMCLQDIQMGRGKHSYIPDFQI
jgi:hypothetical protein